MTFRSTTIPLALALAALPLLGSAPLLAETESTAARLAQAQPAEGRSVSEADLKAFAMAAQEVRRIQSAYQPRIDEAASTDQVQQLRRQAANRMVEAIAEQGLTVDQYNRINTLARDDRELRSVIQKHMQEAR